MSSRIGDNTFSETTIDVDVILLKCVRLIYKFKCKDITMATPSTEIRKLQPDDLYKLSQILDQSDSWKKLMSMVPRENGEGIRFNSDHVKQVEQGMRQSKRSGAEIFLTEWATMGRQRPTCQFVLDLLVKAELFRAADYLAVNVLKRDPPERPKVGPAAAIEVSEKMLEELLKQQARITPPQPQPQVWSLNYRENPANVKANIDCVAEVVRPDTNESNLAEKEKSDLMEFSISRDLIEFSKSSVVKSEDKFVLEALPTEDLPVFVRYNNDSIPVYSDPKTEDAANNESEQADSTRNTTVSDSTNHNTSLSDSRITTETTEESTTSTFNQESNRPVVSESTVSQIGPNIPLVVMEYNAKADNCEEPSGV